MAVEEFRHSGVIIQSVKAGKNKDEVRWYKVEGTEGYVIQYAVRSGFRGAKEITVKSSTATAKTLRKLTGKKTYDIRVKAYRIVEGRTAKQASSAFFLA